MVVHKDTLGKKVGSSTDLVGNFEGVLSNEPDFIGRI